MIQKALRVLLIEDNQSDVVILRHDLAKISSAPIEFEVVGRLDQALSRLQAPAPVIDAILLDLGLPDSQGLATFQQVQRQAPQTPIVVISGLANEEVAIQAVRQGAQDYLVKGRVNPDWLWRSLHYSVERRRIEEALRQTCGELEVRVMQRTAQLADAKAAMKHLISKVSGAGDRVREALQDIIQVISLIIETRDPYTAGHQRGVAHLAQSIACRMALPKERIEGIRLAALVHDLGKISTPAEILAKPTKLTDMEMSLIRTHPRSGYEILNQVEFPWPIALTVLQHHERLNGSGYPEGLAAPDILLEAKILGVADVVEAMCSHRPYRPALGIEEALAEIRRHRGTLYEPRAVDACLAHFHEPAPLPSRKVKKSYKKADLSPSSQASNL